MTDNEAKLILSKLDGFKQLLRVHVTDIREEMKNHAKRSDKNFENLLKCFEKHDVRITGNERWRWKLAGCMAGLGAITTVIAVFTFFIK